MLWGFVRLGTECTIALLVGTAEVVEGGVVDATEELLPFLQLCVVLRPMPFDVVSKASLSYRPLLLCRLKATYDPHLFFFIGSHRKFTWLPIFVVVLLIMLLRGGATCCLRRFTAIKLTPCFVPMPKHHEVSDGIFN